MADYPRVREKYKVSHKQGQCILCGQNKADARLVVEHSYFRGDDSVYKVHWSCVQGKSYTELMQLVLDYWRR